MNTKNILVLGATGNTGLEICNELDRLGIKHSAFVREGSFDKIKTKLTEVVTGNVLNAIDVLNGITSQEYTDIIVALGSRDLKTMNIRFNGTKNVVDALKKNSLKTTVHIISAHGVGDSWRHLKWYEKLISKLLIGKTMQDHSLQEEAAKTTLGQLQIIRPVALKNEPASGKVYSSSNGPMTNGSISRADVANFLIQNLITNKTGVFSICKG